MMTKRELRALRREYRRNIRQATKDQRNGYAFLAEAAFKQADKIAKRIAEVEEALA